MLNRRHLLATGAALAAVGPAAGQPAATPEARLDALLAKGAV